jgi:1-acyl-sn-glycerol-3-phosphate acyltransferase
MFQRLLCASLRVKTRRFGAASAEGSRLIVANHVSWLDIPILGTVEPMTFLAKKEIGQPFLGRQLANLQGVVYVDRQRRRSIPKVNADMAAAMRAGEPVVLFAEATTGDGIRLLRFRSSHFQAALSAGAVVQPVYLHFKRLGGLALGRRDMPKVAWYGDMTFWPHLRALLGCGGVACDVHYGEAIRASDYADRKALARATEAAMRRLAEGARRG